MAKWETYHGKETATFTESEMMVAIKDYQEMIATDRYGKVIMSIGLPVYSDLTAAMRRQETKHEPDSIDGRIVLIGKIGKSDVKIHRNIYDEFVVTKL